MTAVGWIVFGLVCLILIAALAVLKFVRHLKMLPLIVAAALTIAIGIGAYFGLKALFPDKTKEPVVEEVVEETVEEVVKEG